jgi:plasmid stabilization system protein ParE
MGNQVFLSPEALTDLEGVVTYVAVHDPAAAERLGHELVDAAFTLANLPGRGRMVPEFQRPELREIIVQSYRVIYRISHVDNAVEIVRFWHAARGFPHIPRPE